jgi:hypothetical protein
MLIISNLTHGAANEYFENSGSLIAKELNGECNFREKQQSAILEKNGECNSWKKYRVQFLEKTSRVILEKERTIVKKKIASVTVNK